MKLSVSFSDLNIATSQMNGLKALASELVRQEVASDQGQQKLREFVIANGGEVQDLHFSANGESVRVLEHERFMVAQDES
ncbi:hypothetical protein L4D09_26610 [Photobacterium makurazakiensis]|uniref:hypothetical protein n=1 Tax=Photobacterium makurazakiensis TaxID=2910234 RepID=UPI003D0BC36D